MRSYDMSSKRLVSIFTKMSFEVIRRKKHIIMKNKNTNITLTIPNASIIPNWMIRNIIKQAGLPYEMFEKCM